MRLYISAAALTLLCCRPAFADVKTLETAGDIVQIAIPAIAYGTTFYLDDTEGRKQFHRSFASNMAATYGIKYAVNRTRPNGGDYSFPSGHTSASFQGAAFIHKRYGLKYAVPAYIGAGFVGYSRIKAKKHYLSDVLAGAALGMASSMYFTKTYQNMQISTMLSPEYSGVQVSHRF